jgi:hypothetical protein
VQLSGPWTREDASASGQVFEFTLWALLTEQSRGQLHVFLPLADRGIDAGATPTPSVLPEAHDLDEPSVIECDYLGSHSQPDKSGVPN